MASLRRGNRCIRCGAEVRVADMYARVLSVLSLVIGVVLMWEFGFRVLNIFVFSPVIWFLVLMVMVRVAPHIVPPRLELRDLSDKGREEIRGGGKPGTDGT
jgi:hypothetical protein